MKFYLNEQFESILPNKQIAVVYQPNKDYSDIQAYFALFMAEPNFDIEILFNFKQKVQAELLIAIVPEDTNYSCLKIADKIIYCDANQVEALMQVFNLMNDGENLTELDASHIFSCFEQTNTISFISYKSSLDDLESNLERYKNNLQFIISGLSTDINLITQIITPKIIEANDLKKIAHIVDFLGIEPLNSFSSIAVSEEANQYYIANLVFWNNKDYPKLSSNAILNQLPLADGKLNTALLTLMGKQNKANDKDDLYLVIGVDDTSKENYLNLVQAEHLLIAGCQSKTQEKLLHTFLTSMLMQCSPEQLKFVLIDNDDEFFTTYENIPHLISCIINDKESETNSLDWCQLEMERRFNLIKRANVQNLAELNQKIEEAQYFNTLMAQFKNSESLNSPNYHHFSTLKSLPRIVIVVSELKNLLENIASANAVLLNMLITKAHTVGIHLILATNVPHFAEINKVFQCTIYNRIASKVRVKTESKVILGTAGAEILQDDEILFLSSVNDAPISLQPIFATPEEISNARKKWQDFDNPTANSMVSEETKNLIRNIFNPAI